MPSPDTSSDIGPTLRGPRAVKLALRLALALSLASLARAAEQDFSPQPVPDFVQARQAPLNPAGGLALPEASDIAAQAALPALVPAAAAQRAPVPAAVAAPAPAAPSHPRLIDTLSAAQPELGKMGGAESAQAAERDFDARAQLAGGGTREKDRAQAIVEAYQEGRLAEAGVDSGLQAQLDAVAKRAAQRTLERSRFKTKFIYGLLGTRVYESEDLPGLILKTYFSPFGRKGKSWRGYSLAKDRLGGLFAETTLVDGPLTVVVDGKPRRLSWALAQEEIDTKNGSNWSARAGAVLEKMERRGVRDKDVGPRPGFHPAEFSRNLGETADGRFVHFDADFFVQLPQAAEGPKRVRDPPALRRAIEQDQLDFLARSNRN